MPGKTYGPTIGGKVWTNDYKTADAHPKYKTSSKFHLKVDEPFLKHLVQALRTEGEEPRIAVAVWENSEDNNDTTLYVKLEAVAATPEDAPQAAPEPAPAPTPATLPPEINDDIPF